jgi:hypothetical protein
MSLSAANQAALRLIIADSLTPRLRGDAPKIKNACLYTIAYSRVCRPPLSDPEARS